MNFINILLCNFGENKIDKIPNYEEKILNLEEQILALNWGFEYQIEENFIIIFNQNYKNNEKINFTDYIEVGKILKNFLIENNLANNENYKNFFKIEKKIIEEKTEISIEKLDSMIFKVDKNDPKLLEVLGKLEKIKNKKSL